MFDNIDMLIICVSLDNLLMAKVILIIITLIFTLTQYVIVPNFFHKCLGQSIAPMIEAILCEVLFLVLERELHIGLRHQLLNVLIFRLLDRVDEQDLEDLGAVSFDAHHLVWELGHQVLVDVVAGQCEPFHILHNNIHKLAPLFVEHIVIRKHLTLGVVLHDLVRTNAVISQSAEPNADLAPTNEVHLGDLLFFNKNDVLLGVGRIEVARNEPEAAGVQKVRVDNVVLLLKTRDTLKYSLVVVDHILV